MDEQNGTSGAALAIEGLSKSFPGHLGLRRKRVVDGLDLTVGRGEVCGLLGPNGAGKTTTLKLVLGLLRADRGRVSIFGRPPADPAARARVGYLPEHPYFYSYLKAGEFLDFYAQLHGISRADRPTLTRRALATVGLSGHERTPLHRMSKGMVQRLGLAQAIQHDPELVLLDEPMSGLDPIGRREVRDLILELRRRGKSVFFSSHILQDAELVCDRVAILVGGKLRCAGRLDELVSGRVRWFELSVRGPLPEPLPAEVVARDGAQTLLRVTDVERLAPLLAALAAAGTPITSLWPRRETLEDLFLQQVRP
jgi:ABC-2 type transport system ATP-binding protein